jgi:glycosyltransferase involved in cell wall biosynthesis
MAVTPLITIITAVRNATATLEKTMLSVLNQTYPYIEYIIVDGASSDGTVEIIRNYELRIKNREFPNVSFRWISEPDRGIYDAMNKGIDMATGEWINFMNSGDWFVDNEVLSIVFQCSTVCKADIITGIANTGYRKILPINENKLSLFMLYKYGICHQATFIRAELQNRELYDANLKIAADRLFFINQLICGDARYQSITVSICHYDRAGVSSNEDACYKEVDTIMEVIFGNKILADYKMMIYYYNPLFRLLFPVTRFALFKNLIKFIKAIIKY